MNKALNFPPPDDQKSLSDIYNQHMLNQHFDNLTDLGYDLSQLKEFYEKNHFIDDSISTFKEQFDNKSFVNTMMHSCNDHCNES